MENPEKIYLASFDEKPDVLDRTWYWEKQYNCYNTEYIRTDAFIGKACEWLKFNYAEFTDNTRLGIKIDELINDFKKDMEEQL